MHGVNRKFDNAAAESSIRVGRSQNILSQFSAVWRDLAHVGQPGEGFHAEHLERETVRPDIRFLILARLASAAHDGRLAADAGAHEIVH